MFVDTHTHFYDEWLLPEADEAVRRALDAGVGKMIQADIDSRERKDMWAVWERHKDVLFQMLGLYPGSVNENWKEELDALEPYKDKGVVAIGEIGLDYHEGKEFAREQKEVLRLQLEMASAMNLPVSFHLRDAWEDFFDVIKDCRHLGIRGVLHCFSGSYEVYLRANQYGEFSVGIGGVITFKNSNLAATVARIPMEHILLETDAPYLAPVPHRGERNESAYLPLIAAKVAEVKGMTVEEVADITTQNAQTLFKI